MKEPMYLPAVDGAALTELFCRLVAIDNPSYGERQMADTVTTHLRALGLDVIEDGAAKRVGGNAGNLYAYAPGVGALADAVPIACCAHLDSVSPAVGKHAVVGADGRITSTGDTVLGADDLSAVAAMLENARMMNRAKQEIAEPDQEDPEEEQHVEDTALFQSRQRINEMLEGLTEQESKLIALRFGLEGGLPMSPEETGRKLGLTPEEVVAMEAAALVKMRNN